MQASPPKQVTRLPNTANLNWIEPMDVFQMDPEQTTTRWACIDSGSDISLVDCRVAEDLGVTIYEHPLEVEVLGGGKLMLKGYILLRWRKAIEQPARGPYVTMFYLMPENHRADFLLGQDWLSQPNSLTVQHPRTYIVHIPRFTQGDNNNQSDNSGV